MNSISDLVCARFISTTTHRISPRGTLHVDKSANEDLSKRSWVKIDHHEYVELTPSRISSASLFRSALPQSFYFVSRDTALVLLMTEALNSFRAPCAHVQ
ncbi:hypothetical protein EVAR_61245_1 [Eumeta japonica]|uniref:Uncharacterized protein n=1 Tax=Eumeta variegata TaxID=151549 RepID=A0A4C1Z7D5_EUMVA|nr:hypothetical protein EVAR_61245_1 [Eumeta japonica]